MSTIWIMRAAAVLGVLIGLCAACAGHEVKPPRLSPDVALLGLLLAFAYVGGEFAELTQHGVKTIKKMGRRRSRR